MRALWAVYKRELAYFFRSPIAYASASGLLLFLGIVFASSVGQFVSYNQSGLAPVPIPASEVVIGHLGTLAFLLFVFAPLLAMRLLSEEAREGTLEVLMTLPMPDYAFVAGKFLAAWTFYTVLLGLTLAHVGLLAGLGTLSFGATAVAYLGAWLYGGAALALALIWSAVSEDQIVAAFLGSATILVLFLADGLAALALNQAGTAPLAELLRELSLQAHYQQTLLQGVLRAEDVLYFLILISLALFVTTLIVGSRRWRRS